MPSLSAEKDNVISFTDVTIVEDRKIPLCQWDEDAKSCREILVGHSEVKNIFLSTASDRQESAGNYIKMYWKLVVALSGTTRGHQGVITQFLYYTRQCDDRHLENLFYLCHIPPLVVVG